MAREIRNDTIHVLEVPVRDHILKVTPCSSLLLHSSARTRFALKDTASGAIDVDAWRTKWNEQSVGSVVRSSLSHHFNELYAAIRNVLVSDGRVVQRSLEVKSPVIAIRTR